MTPRRSAQRWLEGGWSSYDRAAGYFRRLWMHALECGLSPGEPLDQGRDVLMWLVQGHPQYAEMTLRGLNHFTFRPDGRGNHRFVLVDGTGKEHPFSTYTALTGFDKPLRLPPTEDEPFDGVTS